MTITLSPESVVRTGPLWTVAVNRNQNLLGKTMLVATRDVTAVPDLTPAEWTALHAEISTLTAALTELFEPDQFNHAFLMNQDAQVHLHVVPRYTSGRTWRGHTFTDPHWGELYGKEQQPLPPDDLAALAAEIRETLP